MISAAFNLPVFGGPVTALVRSRSISIYWTPDFTIELSCLIRSHLMKVMDRMRPSAPACGPTQTAFCFSPFPSVPLTLRHSSIRSLTQTSVIFIKDTLTTDRICGPDDPDHALTRAYKASVSRPDATLDKLVVAPT